MRKEDKMTGKGNLKRYYLPKYREGAVWVIRDRENGNQVYKTYYNRDEARADMLRLGGHPGRVGKITEPPGISVVGTEKAGGV